MNEENQLNKVYTGLHHLYPSIPKEAWTIQRQSGGLTNILFNCHSSLEGDHRHLMYRVYGHGSHRLIDRQTELANIDVLSKIGLAAPIVARFPDALVYEFVHGTPLDVASTRDNYRLVAAALGSFHRLATQSIAPQTPNLFSLLLKWIAQVPDPLAQSRYLHHQQQIQTKLHSLLPLLSVVLCHNDLLPGNIILTDNACKFIDFEYAAFNFAAFDIANHFCEYAGTDCLFDQIPGEAFISNWLDVYNQHSQTQVSLDQVVQMLPVPHFYWSVWAELQALNSNIDFDYASYSQKRLSFFVKTFY